MGSGGGDDNEYIYQIMMKQLDIIETIHSRDEGEGSNARSRSAEVTAALREILRAKVPAQIILAAEGSRVEQVGVKNEGDKFEDVGAGATIINRSSLSNCLNSVRASLGKDVAESLSQLAGIVAESKDGEAVDNFNALSEELEKPHPRISLLKSFWMGILAALPAVAEMADLGEKILKLFS